MPGTFRSRTESGLRWCAAVGIAVLLTIAVEPVAAGEPPSDDESDGQRLSAAEVNALLDQTVNDPLYDAIAALEAHGVGGVDDRFPTIFAGIEVVDDGVQMSVLYNANGDKQALEDFLGEVASVASTANLKVQPVPVAFDPQQRAELARKISADSKFWAERLGVSSVASVSFNTVSGEISIMTPDTVGARVTIEVDGVCVTVVGGAGAPTPQGAVGSASWSGAATLRVDTSPGGAG